MAIGISTTWNIKKHDNLYIYIHHHTSQYSSYKIIKMQTMRLYHLETKRALLRPLSGTPHQGQECCLHWIRRWAAGRKAYGITAQIFVMLEPARTCARYPSKQFLHVKSWRCTEIKLQLTSMGITVVAFLTLQAGIAKHGLQGFMVPWWHIDGKGHPVAQTQQKGVYGRAIIYIYIYIYIILNYIYV